MGSEGFEMVLIQHAKCIDRLESTLVRWEQAYIRRWLDVYMFRSRPRVPCHYLANLNTF